MDDPLPPHLADFQRRKSMIQLDVSLRELCSVHMANAENCIAFLGDDTPRYVLIRALASRERTEIYNQCGGGFCRFRRSVSRRHHEGRR